VGDAKLIPAHYFKTPRQSGIPYGYFEQRRRHRNLIVALVVLLLLVACAFNV
jgi:hypothetical protein